MLIISLYGLTGVSLMNEIIKRVGPSSVPNIAKFDSSK